MQPVLGRLAHDGRAEGIGNDEADVGGKNLARHFERGSEEQPVAMQPVIDPLPIGAKVGRWTT